MVSPELRSVPAKGVYVSPGAPPPSAPEPPEHERVHFLALADAFIAQAERCRLDLDDALSELKVRARIKGSRAARGKVVTDLTGGAGEGYWARAWGGRMEDAGLRRSK